jgi:hypothetical protein
MSQHKPEVVDPIKPKGQAYYRRIVEPQANTVNLGGRQWLYNDKAHPILC